MSAGHTQAPQMTLLTEMIASCVARCSTRGCRPDPFSVDLQRSSLCPVVDVPQGLRRHLCMCRHHFRRIRLPSHLLSENGGAAIRGWYAIKDEASGEHRGKVHATTRCIKEGKNAWPAIIGQTRAYCRGATKLKVGRPVEKTGFTKLRA